MSEIPYYFETPVPKYFRETGWFDDEKTFKFVTWAFSKCQTIAHKEVLDGREVVLQPFEFVCGRNKSAKSCFLTPDEFRTQLNWMQNAGLLKISPNSVPNRFTCYVWVTEAFSKHNPQQNPQQVPNWSPTGPHKSERKNKDISFKDVSFRDCGNVHNSANLDTHLVESYEHSAQSDSSFSCSQNILAPSVLSSEHDNLKSLEEFAYFDGKKTDGPTLMRWIKTYSPEEVMDAMLYCVKMHKKGKVDNPIAYTEKALQGKWAEVEKKREFGRKQDKALKHRERRNENG